MLADNEPDPDARDERYALALHRSSLLASGLLVIGAVYLLWAGATGLAVAAGLFAGGGGWTGRRTVTLRRVVPGLLIVAVAYACVASIALGRSGLGYLPLLSVAAMVMLAPSLGERTKREVAAVLVALLVLLPLLAVEPQVPLAFDLLPTWMHVLFTGLSLLLGLSAAAQQLDAYERSIVRLGESLQEVARTDRLTSLPTRAALEQQLFAEIARARRSEEPLTVTLLDIDSMREISERHGHGIGDAVLRVAASTLQKALRHYDYVGRWDGQQFLIVMSRTSLIAASTVCDRLRALVENAARVHGGSVPPFTASFGVAAVALDGPPEQAISAAREALALAQSSGNRVGQHQAAGPVLVDLHAVV